MEKLKRYDLNCNIFSVYDYDGLSIQELLCQFFTKINECVDFSNSTLDLCEWLVNEGLKVEVATKLSTWLNDGTLENIINVSLFENLNKKIDGISSELKQKVNKDTIYYYNVKDFGAKGNANYLNSSDGKYYVDSAFTTLSDDDTLAFNNALLWESEHTTGNNTELKRTVYIPEGNYLIKGTVYVRKGQHLKGSGIGSTRILIPVTERTQPTFLMGVNSNGVADSGGLAPSISDLSTEGGSIKSAIFDCGKTAGISLYNLFITTAGIGINAQAGDLNTYNLTIDMCQVGMMLGGSSRNVITTSSFFWNYDSIIVNDNCYDTIISSCNFAFGRVTDINIKASGIHENVQTSVKNLKISDCNFIANGQYDTFAGSIILNNCIGQDININSCSFRNINGYAIASIGTSKENIVVVDNCIIDGNRTHHKYLQGSNSKGIIIGENDFTISNCKFKNIKGDKTILLNGVNGKAIIYGCTWNNINSQGFIEYTNAGKEYVVHSNTGDNIKPLIVLNGSSKCNLKYFNNVNWLGSLIKDNGKQYYKIPSFNGYFLSNIKIAANPNNTGSAHYRTNTFLTVCRNCTHNGSNVQNRLEIHEVYKTGAISSYSPNLDVTVAFDNINGGKESGLQENRYICVGVPDTYTYVSVIID